MIKQLMKMTQVTNVVNKLRMCCEIITKIPFIHVRYCSHAIEVTRAKLIVNNRDVLPEMQYIQLQQDTYARR